MTREAILQATADQIAERGLIDFSIPDIAKRAGVSHRTVYNYFADRQELLEAFMRWLDDKFAAMGGYNAVSELDDLVDAVRVNYRLFGKMGDLYVALAQVDSSSSTAFDKDRQRRTDMFVSIARAELTHLPGERIAAMANLFRTIGSSKFWYSLTVERGLTSEDAGDIAAWALENLIAAARAENK